MLQTTKNLHYLQDIYIKNYEDYLIEKFKRTREIFNTIDWQIIGTYSQTPPVKQKVTYVKFLHKLRLTQKKIYYANPDRCSSPACILCGALEDNDN